VRHVAGLSNLWAWKPETLIEWHREKAGTVEMVHDVLKNELAAGVLRSKYFGCPRLIRRLTTVPIARDGSFPHSYRHARSCKLRLSPSPAPEVWHRHYCYQ
jgi:hypothetical protein